MAYESLPMFSMPTPPVPPLPQPTPAAPLTYETIDITSLSGAVSGTGWNFGGGILSITASGNYKITDGSSGAVTSNHIVVASGVAANIILSDVKITSNDAPIDIMAGASVNLYLDGQNNELTALNYDAAAIHVPETTSLTITSISGDGFTNGKLEATSGFWAAGIGGGYFENGGTITINGGNIRAVGSQEGAGIGGGLAGEGGNIFISGGVVDASGIGGAGIGGGEGGAGYLGVGNGGNIFISGGVVNATSNLFSLTGGAGIGGGNLGNGGNIYIFGGTVTAIGERGAGIGGGDDGGNGGNIYIFGGIINATSNHSLGGAGIGGGYGGGGGNIYISNVNNLRTRCDFPYLLFAS
ncbi:hypothetical protein AGMMS50276_32580 [Synergistales bacterium]|nr:hypothetical protein AGMMS50276_32580 [Synergistales bacterium]